MICPGKPTVVAKALGSNNPLHWVKATTVKPITSKINMKHGIIEWDMHQLL